MLVRCLFVVIYDKSLSAVQREPFCRSLLCVLLGLQAFVEWAPAVVHCIERLWIMGFMAYAPGTGLSSLEPLTCPVSINDWKKKKKTGGWLKGGKTKKGK